MTYDYHDKWSREYAAEAKKAAVMARVTATAETKSDDLRMRVGEIAIEIRDELLSAQSRHDAANARLAAVHGGDTEVVEENPEKPLDILDTDAMLRVDLNKPRRSK